METIEKFAEVGFGSGYGYGSGFGYGSGYGSGSGRGIGYGDGGSSLGDGSGYGFGSGYGYTSGCGFGHGCGYGYGNGSTYASDLSFGDSSGSGCGYGRGRNSGIKSFGGKNIYIIDEVPTIIESVRDNIAKGYILQSDFTLTPCYVVKDNNLFAHGNTLHEAFDALQEKLYDNSSEEERIEKFKEHFRDFSRKYPAKDLFIWHHTLTGSCKAGRESFCKNRGINIDTDSFTIYEFIDITKDSYGGEIIKRLLD